MKHSAIITHKDGFQVDAFADFSKQTIELRKMGETHSYFKGHIDLYTNFAGNMQDFVNAHEFNNNQKEN